MLGFIFDLDGTLIDSRADIARATNHALVSLGREPLPESTIGTFVGDGARMLLVRAFGGEQDLDRALALYLAYYEQHPFEHSRWMPGAREILERLEPAALVTNKSQSIADRIVDVLGIRHRFRAVIGGAQGPLKPDPAPLRLALAALGTTPGNTWMIGDGVQDIGAGRAAGCVTVAVLGGFQDEARLRAAGPDRVVRSLLDLASEFA